MTKKAPHWEDSWRRSKQEPPAGGKLHLSTSSHTPSNHIFGRDKPVNFSKIAQKSFLHFFLKSSSHILVTLILCLWNKQTSYLRYFHMSYTVLHSVFSNDSSGIFSCPRLYDIVALPLPWDGSCELATIFLWRIGNHISLTDHKCISLWLFKNCYVLKADDIYATYHKWKYYKA